MVDTKQIRKDLKKMLGYNARQVSVSGKNGNVTFTIRDEGVDIEKVQNFGGRYERVMRDEITQCILCGGNTFVDVRFSEQINKIFNEKYSEIIEKEINTINGNHFCRIGNWLVSPDQRYKGWFEARKDGDDFINVTSSNSEGLSNQICKHGGIIFEFEEKKSRGTEIIFEKIEFGGNEMTLI
jgi:hypothetical protein